MCAETFASPRDVSGSVGCIALVIYKSNQIHSTNTTETTCCKYDTPVNYFLIGIYLQQRF